MLIATHSGQERQPVGGEQLIDTIYQCALGMADWDRVCRDVHAAHPGMGMVLHLHDARNVRNIGVVQDGFDPSAVASYIGHYAQMNPWLPGVERMAVGMLHHTEDVCPREQLLRSEFYCDWLKPQGEFAAGSGLVLGRAFERHAFVGLNYTHKTDKPRDEADDLLRAIGPHLQRAFGLWQRAAIDRERLGVLEGAAGSLTLPIMLVDGQRRLRFANDRAEAILRRLDGLVVGAGRELRAQNRDADDALERAIACVLNDTRSCAPLVLVPKVEWVNEADGHYVIAPCPVPHESEDLGFGTFSFFDGSLVMLVVHDTDASLTLDPHTLSDTFDLTRTEAELAVAMLEGCTLATYSKRKEVSRYTARNQLSSVMRKTGAKRQADLVGLLTRIAMTA